MRSAHNSDGDDGRMHSESVSRVHADAFSECSGGLIALVATVEKGRQS